jgi:aminopeptidase N
MNVEDNLIRDLAQYRSQFISDLNYTVELSFHKGSTSYKGIAEIHFKLRDGADEIPIDFIGSEIETIEINGSLFEDYRYESWKIHIPTEQLVKGNNLIRVSYQNQFDTNGVGLHRFMEKETQLEYIFSDLEPFECHKIFPCFDQPDLKAEFRLKVRAPWEWEVASNSPLLSREDLKDRRLHIFQPTRAISTYLFGLVAGDFLVRDQEGFRYPMRILYRAAMEDYIPFEKIFEWTTGAMDHFESYLKVPYPFEKYDQVFLPEYDGGAMENAGLVTFTERYLSRSKPTASEVFELAGTVVHELAHMWFGNLVTMKWWDGLWLNEAFATFFGYEVLGKLESFQEWELYFTQDVKNRAFHQDQASTTHPIVADCADTDTAFANFDPITYEKAAAVLRQLIFRIGEDSFRAGLHEYLLKYSFGVTELSDFLSSMQIHAPMDLHSWSREWLETANLNTVRPEVSEVNGQISSLVLHQSAPTEFPTLREHGTRLALFEEVQVKDRKILRATQVYDVTYSGPSTKVEGLEGVNFPRFLFCNYGDHDYAKSYLDPKSLEELHSIYPMIEESLTRQLIWNSLTSMVLDAQYSPLECMNLGLELVSEEPVDSIAIYILNTVSRCLYQFLPDELYQKECAKVFEHSQEQLKSTDLSYDLKCKWYSILLSSCVEINHFELLSKDLHRGMVGTLHLDRDRRWSATKLLSYARHPEANHWIEVCFSKDPGDLGLKYATEARLALEPDKERALEELLKNKNLSADLCRAHMRAFFHRLQKAECEKLVPKYFENLSSVFGSRDRIFSRDFSEYLFPSSFPKTAARQTHEMLDSNPGLPYLLRRSLRENLDEVERVLRIQKQFFLKL